MIKFILIIVVIKLCIELTGSNVMVSRTVSVTTSTTPIFQRAGINLPRLNTAYYSQIKTNDSAKISFRPSMYLKIIK